MENSNSNILEVPMSRTFYILPSSIKHLTINMKFINIPFVDTWLGQGRIFGIGFECIEELGIINKWLDK